MGRFVQGEDRRQDFLLPASLDDYVSEDNPVRVVEAFIDELDFHALGFAGVTPAETGRPAYHPSTMLKIYLYGYLNRLQSTRRLEREAQRNIELMWLTGRLAPDFKTIANFRRDNADAIRSVCTGKTTIGVSGCLGHVVHWRPMRRDEGNYRGSAKRIFLTPETACPLTPDPVVSEKSSNIGKRGRFVIRTRYVGTSAR